MATLSKKTMASRTIQRISGLFFFVLASIGSAQTQNDFLTLKGGKPRGLQDILTLQKTVHQLTPLLIEKTVAVQVGRANGSGVIVSQDGYILTAAHVAGTPDRDALIYLADGRQLHGKTLGLNEVLDAGLIKLSDAGPWPFAEFGKSASVGLGQWCLATGHPGGYDPSREPVIRLGRILRSTQSAIISDCTLVGGDSGGPLFDLNGDVIAIHSRIGKNLNVNVHVPIDRYRRSWNRLVRGEAWDLFQGQAPATKNWIGIVQDPSVANSIRIKSIYDNSPAQMAGIQAGDEIVKFNGIRVTQFDLLKKHIRNRKPGDSVKVQLRRDGTMVDVTIRIGSISERATQR